MVIFQTRARIGAIGLLSVPTAWLIRRGHRPSIKSKRNRRRRRSGFGARLGRPSLARPREQQDGYIPNQSTDWRDRPVVRAYGLADPPRPPPVDQVKKKSAAPAVGIRSAAREAQPRAPARAAGWLYSSQSRSDFNRVRISKRPEHRLARSACCPCLRPG